MNQLSDVGNSVKEAARRGEVSLGSFLLSANSMIAEVMALGPIDWMVIDMEASHASKGDLLHLLQTLNAYDVTPIVRVPDHGKHFIEACLDFGAKGIVAPKVDTAEQAARIVSACYYSPKGERSVNCIRASSYYTQAGPYIRNANETVLSLLQIESAEGVEQAHAIAGIAGVDGLFLGPGDLAASYGQIGNVTGKRMDDARRRVVAACREYGKIPGIFAHDAASANQYIAEGFVMVALGNDIKFLSMGLAETVRRVRLPVPGIAPGEAR